MLCDRLRERGFCDRIDCPLVHGTVCPICYDKGPQIILSGKDALAQHNLSRAHLRRAFTGGFECGVCKTNSNGNAYNFSSHFMSPRHLRNCEAIGVLPFPGLQDTILFHCFPCKRFIQKINWAAHIGSKTHSRKLTKYSIPLPAATSDSGTKPSPAGHSTAGAPPPPSNEPLRTKSARKKWKYGLHGERLAFTHNVIFTEALPDFPVPERIRQVVNEGNIDAREDAIHEIIPSVTPTSDHVRFWSTLLHVEEMQDAKDLEQFNMEECSLIPENGFYKLEVEGLAERRPSVLLNDQVKLHRTGAGEEDQGFIGYVHMVHERFVFLALHKSFDSSYTYDVEFSLSRISFRRMHQAISLNHGLRRVIDPDAPSVGRLPPSPTPFTPLDGALVDNPPQRGAVSSILGMEPNSPPYIVYGPPGTGKTLVVVEAIRQLLLQTGTTILACAPSNYAADVIAERLVKLGVSSAALFRLNALSRPVFTLPESLEKHSLIANKHFDVPPIEELLQYRVIVSTCVSSSLLYATGAERGHFSHIFVDEAGYALEPEALVPILTIADSGTRVVLSGDPKQLGPISRSPGALSFGFGKSYLARLMESPMYSLENGANPFIIKLLQNYRSHESILDFPNRKFYEGELVPCVDRGIADRFLHWDELRGNNFPVLFHAVHGRDDREAQSPSYFNSVELEVVDRYVKELLGVSGVAPEDIGIISPYRAQNKKLRALEVVKAHSDVLKVGTVEAFQAQERPIIVLSTVRSNPDTISFDIRHSLGFVANAKRLNVAVTRARSLLIIIGDPAVLSLDQVWNELLHFIRAGGGWRGVEFELPALDDEEGAVSSLSDAFARRLGFSDAVEDTELEAREDE